MNVYQFVENFWAVNVDKITKVTNSVNTFPPMQYRECTSSTDKLQGTACPVVIIAIFNRFREHIRNM